jgi:hypothetical protein
MNAQVKTNTIFVEVKNVYGTPTVYPVCQTAQKFAQLTGKKTFAHKDLQTIEALGFVIDVVKPTLPL